MRIVSDRSCSDEHLRSASDELDSLAQRFLEMTAAYERCDQLPRAHPIVREMAAAARDRVPATSRGVGPPLVAP